DAVAGVTEFGDPVGRQADGVSGDHVAGRGAVGDPHAVAAVAADDVAGRGRRAADRVTVRSIVEPDATTAVGDRGGAGEVGPDVVAQNRVARDVRSVQPDAVRAVPG